MHSFRTGLAVVACFVALNAASAGLVWAMFTLTEAVVPGFMRQPLLVFFIAWVWLGATICLSLFVVSKFRQMHHPHPPHGLERN